MLRLVRAELYRLAVTPVAWASLLLLIGLEALSVLLSAGAWTDCTTFQDVLTRASALGIATVFAVVGLAWFVDDEVRHRALRVVLAGRHAREAYAGALVIVCLAASGMAVVIAAVVGGACYLAVGGQPVAVDAGALAAWWAAGTLDAAATALMVALAALAAGNGSAGVAMAVITVTGLGYWGLSAAATLVPTAVQPALSAVLDLTPFALRLRLNGGAAPQLGELAWMIALIALLALAAAAILRRRELR